MLRSLNFDLMEFLSYLWGHPVWCTDECVSPTDGSVELRADTEIDELDLGVVGEQHVLALDITMDDLARVQVRQTANYLAVK